LTSVEFSQCSKRYEDGTVALNDFSLAIGDGEFMVLVGPSGCGKSTCLRLLAGLEQPNSGEIYIDGELITRAAPQRRNIAMVFQNYALYPHMSVFNNLAFPLEMAKFKKDEINNRVGDVAATLQLTEFLHKNRNNFPGASVNGLLWVEHWYVDLVRF